MKKTEESKEYLKLNAGHAVTSKINEDSERNRKRLTELSVYQGTRMYFEESWLKNSL